MNVGTKGSQRPFINLSVINNSTLHERKPPLPYLVLFICSFVVRGDVEICLLFLLCTDSFKNFQVSCFKVFIKWAYQLHSLQSSFQKRNIRLARDNIVTVGIVRLSKIHGQHQSVIPPSAKNGVMYFIYIRNYRGRKTKRGDCSLEVVLWGTVCVFPVVCVCVCVCGAQTAHTSHPLYSVSLWVICMSLQLCFISEWLLRKLLHKTPVKMEEGSNTDLKKPRAFSHFLTLRSWWKVCVCVWEREREPRCISFGTHTSVGFFF